MKRLLSFIFLVSMIVICCLSVSLYEKSILDECVSIKLITSDECGEGVVNGDTYILELDDNIKFNQIANYEYTGITIYYKVDWDYKKLFLDNFIITKNYYYIDDILVIEGELKNELFNANTYQLAVTKTNVIVGYPSILNGF